MSIRAKTLRASSPLLLAVLAILGLVRLQTAKGDEDGKFDPTGWETKTDYAAIGDPRAKRDCKDPFVMRWQEFPPTLRSDGPNSRLLQSDMVNGLIFETLVQIHPDTQEFLPCLASHWKREIDEKNKTQTFWFHLDPRAKFADGSPVTAEDVAASFGHAVQDDVKDPTKLAMYKDRYDLPEVVDKHTVRVKGKDLTWRLFLDLGIYLRIFKASEIKIPGDKYIADYNWKFPTGTGPYYMKPEDLKKGESLTLTRRDDYWAEHDRWAKNTYNFAKIKFTVVREEEIYFQVFKKGELDHFFVSRAKQWKQEVPQEDVVKKGWVKRRKIFHQGPQGFAGFAFNMREKPFNDKNVRLACCYLFNREKLMETIFLNEYEFLNSYDPGRDWGSEDENEIITFDPKKAGELLAAAGYKNRNAAGILTDADGKPFELTLDYGIPSFEKIFLIVKEDFEKAGIKLTLNLMGDSTLSKKRDAREFKILYEAWTGDPFPDPKLAWSSELADKEDSINLTGFKNARVDELVKKVDLTFDVNERKKLCREVDKLVYAEHPYALGWGAPYQRILYWDKYGHPDAYMTRTFGQANIEAEMMLLWWFDTDKIKALDEAKATGKTLEQGQVDVHPWEKK